MVVIEINKNDLLRLIGKEMNDEEIEEILFLLKIEGKINGEKIECELNPDRPDMFSVEGIAREMKGFLGIEAGLPKYEVSQSDVVLKREGADVRPYIACAIIKDVNLSGELIRSLMQLQEKLHTTIGRNRRKVAIGIHDFDKIKSPLVYKDVNDVKFVPLGMDKEMNINEILTTHPKGVKFSHLVKERYPVIIDKEGVISFPPIINSERTKLTETTKNLFIDVTGTDEKAVNQILNILVCNIVERCGKILSVKVSNKVTPDLRPREANITTEYVNRILGLDLTEGDIVKTLERMRYSILRARSGKISFLIPPYRCDILHAIDIIEDIAVGYGYDKIEPILPKVSTVGGQSEIEKISRKFRELMIGLGFQEVLNFILTSKLNNFEKMCLEGSAVEILNPVSSEYEICRTWLLPSLMKVLMANKHREYPQKVFEIGDCVLFDDNAETGTKRVRKLAGVISYDDANLTEIKSIVEVIMKAIGCNYSIRELEHPSFIKSRCGEVLVNDERIGFFGEIHPKVLENWDLERPVIAFEILIKTTLP
jgi:phenylalanyl-tRNA synthetase beta chain